jgi:hypothetical protein
MSFVTRIIIFVLLLMTGAVYAAVPRLFSEDRFTAALFAEAVNHFVALGEDAARKELDGLTLDGSKDFEIHGDGQWSVNDRIGWMCRVLFEPKNGNSLRGPLFGAPNLPYHTMPDKSWPQFPVALSGSTYFVLSQGYMLGGRAEDPRYYVDYCHQNGVFRKAPLKVPTQEEALKAAATLRASAAWKAIKWNDSGEGWSYSMEEPWAWKFIQRQADAIPPS